MRWLSKVTATFKLNFMATFELNFAATFELNFGRLSSWISWRLLSWTSRRLLSSILRLLSSWTLRWRSSWISSHWDSRVWKSPRNSKVVMKFSSKVTTADFYANCQWLLTAEFLPPECFFVLFFCLFQWMTPTTFSKSGLKAFIDQMGGGHPT